MKILDATGVGVRVGVANLLWTLEWAWQIFGSIDRCWREQYISV